MSAERSAELGGDLRLDCTDEDGRLVGRVEVDHTPDGVLVEVFDASYFDGATVTSAVTFMSREQAARLAAALSTPPGAPS